MLIVAVWICVVFTVVAGNEQLYRHLYWDEACQPFLESVRRVNTSAPSCPPDSDPLAITDPSVFHTEYHVGEVIEFPVFTSCTAGGTTWRLDVKGPSGRLVGNVIDNMDSTYTVKIYAGVSGVFDVQLTAFLYNYEGLGQCSNAITRLKLTPAFSPGTAQLTILPPSDASPNELYSYSPYFGMWSVEPVDPISSLCLTPSHRRAPKSSLVWKPFASAENGYEHIPLSGVRGKWIHFMGLSTTMRFKEDFVRLLNCSFQSVSVQWRLVYSPSDLLASLAYFPSLDLLVSYAGHYWGYNASENTFSLDRYWNDSRIFPLADQLSAEHPQHTQAIWKKLNAFPAPDIFLFNWGLHSTKSFGSMQGMREYIDILTAHKKELDAKLGRKSRLMWRTNLPTQWNKRKLSIYSSCRTAARIQCQNELASDIFSDWEQVDLWPMAYPRMDCVPDNRHYKMGNCGFHFANAFLNHIK